eukprot:1648011-Pyramimonas_sp.AAC.2
MASELVRIRKYLGGELNSPAVKWLNGPRSTGVAFSQTLGICADDPLGRPPLGRVFRAGEVVRVPPGEDANRRLHSADGGDHR